MNLRPVNDSIILKAIKPSQSTTKGGLLLPDKVKDVKDWPKYRVIAVGPGMLLADGSRASMSVMPGDIVIVEGNRCTGFIEGGELYGWCQENAIVAVVESGVTVQ